MCVSEKFCKDNLTLLLDLLDSSDADFGIKNNILIGISDLYTRFPNRIHYYLFKIYKTLND